MGNITSCGTASLIIIMAAYLENWQAKLDKVLHQKNAFTDILAQIETKTGVRRLYLALGIGVILGLYLMIGYGASFMCNFVGFLYPAYASIKAIESSNKEDDTKWLTYWVVYSTFHLAEFFADILFFWVPFYWFFKMLFLIYCMVPTSWNGSVKIYNTLIRPWVLKHQTKIEDAMGKASSLAQDVINEEILDKAKAAAIDCLTQTIVQNNEIITTNIVNVEVDTKEIVQDDVNEDQNKTDEIENVNDEIATPECIEKSFATPENDLIDIVEITPVESAPEKDSIVCEVQEESANIESEMISSEQISLEAVQSPDIAADSFLELENDPIEIVTSSDVCEEQEEVLVSEKEIEEISDSIQADVEIVSISDVDIAQEELSNVDSEKALEDFIDPLVQTALSDAIEMNTGSKVEDSVEISEEKIDSPLDDKLEDELIFTEDIEKITKEIDAAIDNDVEESNVLTENVEKTVEPISVEEKAGIEDPKAQTTTENEATSIEAKDAAADAAAAQLKQNLVEDSSKTD